jgi:hypothetical protein
MHEAAATPIVQTMSISRDEFRKSVLAIDPSALAVAADRFRLAVPPGHVTIGYAPLPGVRLGGLLDLPRAEVSLDFEGLDAVEQAAFLRRFEIAFQRGGG